MSHRFAALLVALLVSGSLSPAYGKTIRGPLGADWVLATVVLPEDTRGLTVRTSGTFVVASDGRYARGFGLGSASVTPFVLVLGSTEPEAVVVAGPVYQRIELTPAQSNTVTSTSEMSIVGNLKRGEAFRFLFFVTGTTFDKFSIIANTTAKRVPTRLRTGVGARHVSVVDPSNGGAAVQGGPARAGVVTRTETTGTGIIGGLDLNFDCVGACQSSWYAPDGSTGSVTTAGTPVTGGVVLAAESFAGPKGEWRWEFAGLKSEQFAVAAYAPVGDDWKFFAPRP